MTGRAALPRAVLILIGLAAATITAGGMRAISGFLAPTILALVLMITVYPIRTWLERKGVPAWLSALVTILTVYLIVIVMILALVVSVARLAQLVTEYTPQLNDITTNFGDWLKSLGIDQQQIDDVTSSLDFGKVFNLATTVLTGTLGVLSDIIFLGVLTIFIAFDAGKFPAILASTGPEHSRVAESLTTFSQRDPHLLRRLGGLRPDRGRDRHHRPAADGRPRRVRLGRARLHHQLHPQHRVHHRVGPAGAAGAARGRRLEDGRGDRRLLRDQLRDPVGDPAQVPGRRAQPRRQPDLPVAGLLDVRARARWAPCSPCR